MKHNALKWPVEKSGYKVVEDTDDAARYLFRAGGNAEGLGFSVSGEPTWYSRGPEWSNFHEFVETGRARWVVSADEQHGTRSYDPMKKPGLFRRFVGVELNPQSVLAFAAEFGLLSICQIEPLHHWYDQIKRLRHTVGLYDLAFDEEDRTLDLVALLDLPRKTRRLAATAAAMGKVISIVNNELDGNASLRLVSHPIKEDSGEYPGAGYGFPTGLEYVPRSLQAALWLQFSLQIYGARSQRICQNCGRSFWLKTSDAPGRSRNQRADSMYCEPKCKVAAFRKRRRRDDMPGMKPEAV